MTRSTEPGPDGRGIEAGPRRRGDGTVDGGGTAGERSLSRRTTLALLGLAGVGGLATSASRSAAKPDTDRWKKDQDAQGNDLFGLGDLSFAAAPGETVSSPGDLRIDVRDLASDTTVPGVRTLSIGTGLVVTPDEAGAAVSVEPASESGLGAAVAMTESQIFDGTEPEPWLEWNQVDFVHPDVVSFEDETFTVRQAGIYDLRVSVTVRTRFTTQGEPRFSAFNDLQVVRLPGLADVLMRGSGFSEAEDSPLERTITLARVLPLEEGDEIRAHLRVVSNNLQVVGSTGFPSTMSIVRLG